MNLQYSEIFARRGDAYDAAMRSQPLARQREFAQLFARRELKAGDTVLDVPAGGGYLARSLSRDVAVTQLELSAGFSPDTRVVEERGDWGVGKFDHAVCLAGLHHIDDQDGFVTHLSKHVKPGGVVHVADVDASTGIGKFLDGFVGQYNVTGHQGKYLTDASFRQIDGTKVIASEIRDCAWQFANEDDLLNFAADLFGLVAYPREDLHKALQKVGIDAGGEGVRLNWRLRYVDLEAI